MSFEKIIFILGISFLLVSSRSTTFTCEEDETKNTQGCCPIAEEPSYEQLDPDWECGQDYSFIALPTEWESANSDDIKQTILDNLSEDWLEFYNSGLARCLYLPGCSVAEVAQQSTGQYSIRCRTCMSGYRKTTLNLCEECSVDDCDVCSTSATTCTTCEEGYFITTGGTACNWIPNCLTATPADSLNNDCTTCDSGYYKDANGACQACDEDNGYLTCTGLTAAITCDTQEDYFKKADNTCVYLEWCETSTGADLAADECTTCESGYFLDANGDCQECDWDNGYLTCTGLTAAITCDTEEDYFKKADNTCVYLEWCETSTGDDLAADECTTCESGYFLDANGDCQECDHANGYETCTGLTAAITCHDEWYYFKKADSTCVEILDCEASTGADLAAGQCTTCEDTYYRDANGDCQECTATGAVLCNSDSVAISCQSDYLLIDGVCRMIEDCCQATYSVADGTICTQCAPGYTLSAGECVQIWSDNCEDATAGTTANEYTCNSCSQGYELDTGACVQCPAFPSISVEADCQACGYIYAQDQCFPLYDMYLNTWVTSCYLFNDSDQCILCGYGTNWDSVSMACLPCDDLTAEYYSDILSPTTDLLPLDSCTFNTWTPPQPPAGDSGDSGDNAYTMLFNLIALVVLSFVAFFLV